MVKIVVRMVIAVDDEWATEGADWIAGQAEDMIDNNSGGHANAFVFEIEKDLDED